MPRDPDYDDLEARYVALLTRVEAFVIETERKMTALLAHVDALLAEESRPDRDEALRRAIMRLE